jgi:DNA-binding response OmpR family regulator
LRPEEKSSESGTYEIKTLAAERCLLVEDELFLSCIAARVLKRSGADGETARTLAEALRAVEARRFHTVIVDLHLADGDGEVVVRRLRELPERPGIVTSEARRCSQASRRCRPFSSPVGTSA